MPSRAFVIMTAIAIMAVSIIVLLLALSSRGESACGTGDSGAHVRFDPVVVVHEFENTEADIQARRSRMT